MGILTEGHALSWSEILAVKDGVRSDALLQLIRTFEKCKDRQGDSFMWGDEVELSLVRFDHSNKRVQLLLKAHELLPRLVELNETISDETHRIAWHLEATDYMIEGVPSAPYGFTPSYLNIVEANIALRRTQAQQLLSEQSDCEYVLSLSAFPRLGQGEYTYPVLENPSNPSSKQSLCYPDTLISPLHPRMKSILSNITERRQAKASINIPIFRDTSTPSPFRDILFENNTDILDDHIHLDSNVGGLGCCCLQVTFQAQSFNESLNLYDQLLPLTGIMLALSGACPVWRGFLSDIDCRWNVLSQAADDRTVEEQQQQPNLSSRYGSAPMYLSDQYSHLNDVEIDVDEKAVSTLIEHGIPATLSRHFGHLFIRDPLIVIEEQLHANDDSSSYHFENLNSTVWHSLRFKPPPLDDDQMGWRVEFRPMDIQFTDFENASLTVFVALLTRAIFTYGLDFTIPISQINENMIRAHRRDSVRQEKFYFRIGTESRLMTMNEIINGTNDFVGLVPLVQQYFDEREDVDSDTRLTVKQYLSLISKRAAGILLTDASWIRQFVTSHPDYKHDSIVSDTIQYDLIWKIIQIINGHEPCSSLIQLSMQTNTNLDPN